MESKVLQILKEMNEEIMGYSGENLYKDGLLDSIQVVDLVAQIEETFNVDIAPELVVLENFANKDAIIKFVKQILEEQNAG